MKHHVVPHLAAMNLFVLIVLGQWVALLVTLTGVFSQLLSLDDIHIPTTQSLLNYILLTLVFVPTHILYNQVAQANLLPILLDNNPVQQLTSHCTTSKTLLMYAIIALIDVEGNYLLVHAYQYTSITSIQLLDCFSIPVVILISRIFLHHIYNYKQIFGAVVSLLGLCMLITNDAYSNAASHNTTHAYTTILYGDMYVLIGCILYAASNCAQEKIVKTNDTIQWLAYIGVFGTMWSTLQILIFERDELMILYHMNVNIYNIYYMVGFNISLYLLYLTVPVVLKHSGALFLNLSLLSADFYAIIFAVYLFHQSLNIVYFISFSIIIMGLLLYNIASIDNTMTLQQTIIYILPRWLALQLNIDQSHVVLHHNTSDDTIDGTDPHNTSAVQNKSYHIIDNVEYNKYDTS